MALIDWPYVVRNVLWVLGLAIVLAAWSHASWWAALHHVRLRRGIERAAFGATFAAGMLLFAISLGWGATRGWERILWIMLGLWFAWRLLVGLPFRHAQSTNDSPSPEGRI